MGILGLKIYHLATLFETCAAATALMTALTDASSVTYLAFQLLS
jgi:hypothetical protein